MANSFFQLNYNQLVSIAKKFKDEGEDIAQLHSTTRQRVRDLHKEWIGDAADKFFDEMETELLPAVQRLSQALFLSQDMTNDIMKIIQDADEETVGYFRNQLSGDDFGAGLFGAALQGLQGGPPGTDDFGAGKFGEALGSPPSDGGSSVPEDFGAGKFGEALGGDSSNASDQSGTSGESQGGGGDSSDKKQKEKETPETETEPTTSGGGGGSSSRSSQGLQGDLKNMGVGLSNQAPQTASSGGDSVKMPDHVYSGSDSPKPEGSESKPDSSKPGVETGSGDSEQSSSKGGSIAGGVAGVAGAAAAGKAAKIVKEQQDDST